MCMNDSSFVTVYAPCAAAVWFCLPVFPARLFPGMAALQGSFQGNDFSRLRSRSAKNAAILAL